MIDNENLRRSHTIPDLEQLLRKYDGVFAPVQSIKSARFYEIMMKNSKRFCENASKHMSIPAVSSLENIINSLCHPNVISEVCSNYLKLMNEKTS